VLNLDPSPVVAALRFKIALTRDFATWHAIEQLIRVAARALLSGGTLTLTRSGNKFRAG
jgi:hypothetical protein